MLASEDLFGPLDGFLPSCTTSCTAHADYDVTASQARLHVGGEAAIPLRSSQPCVNWGVSLRGPFLPQYSAATASSLRVSIWWMCPTSWFRWASPVRPGSNDRSLPRLLSLGKILSVAESSAGSWGIFPVARHLFWGFKTTTGDGMI